MFPHKSGPAGAEPVPGLAEDMPEISADGKTYKFKLREGLKFSDGTPIKASDFKALDRAHARAGLPGRRPGLHRASWAPRSS